MLLKGQSVTLCGFVVVCAVWLCLLCLTGPNIVSVFGVHCQFLQGIFVVCVAIFFFINLWFIMSVQLDNLEST